MSTPSATWHFPRHKLAVSALSAFDPGPSYALAIFERRRMGKSKFLLQDFKPNAESKGWLVCYASFLDADPKESFIRELVSFVNRVTPYAVKKLAEAKNIKVEKVKISLGIKDTGVAFELAPGKEPAESVQELFALLEKLDVRCIFLLDEIQVLAESGKAAQANKAFVGTLRTCLDKNKTWARAIFNGSSQNGLRRMFSDKGHAFYRYAHTFDFPTMGTEFTDYLCAQLTASGRNGIDPAEFATLFTGEMGRCPALAMEVCQKLLTIRSLTLSDAWKLVAGQQEADYGTVWEKLTSIQRAVLGFIAKGGEGPYTAEAVESISAAVGMKVPKTTIQGALGALSENKGVMGEILRQPDRGVYEFQDDNFRQFVLLHI
jgi:uncharacterized protein